MQTLTIPYVERTLLTQEEIHLLARLRSLLATRTRLLRRSQGLKPADPRRDGPAVFEKRQLIRDCIARLRQARLGVTSTWLGLGQRPAARQH